MFVRTSHPKYDSSMELLCLLTPGKETPIAAICGDLGNHASPSVVRRLVDSLNTRFVSYGEPSLVLVAARTGYVTLVKDTKRPEYRKMMDAAQEYYQTVYSLDAVKKPKAKASEPTVTNDTKAKRAG